MADRVTINDCRAAGYCVAGVRRQCRLLGLDFRQLVREGLPISEVEHLDDNAVQRSIAVARARTETDG